MNAPGPSPPAAGARWSGDAAEAGRRRSGAAWGNDEGMPLLGSRLSLILVVGVEGRVALPSLRVLWGQRASWAWPSMPTPTWVAPHARHIVGRACRLGAGLTVPVPTTMLGVTSMSAELITFL